MIYPGIIAASIKDIELVDTFSVLLDRECNMISDKLIKYIDTTI